MRNVIYTLFYFWFVISCSGPNEPSLFDANILIVSESSNDLVISNLEGSMKHNLTNSSELIEYDFDVSPIASQIVFQRRYNPNDELCIMDFKGENLVVLKSSIGLGSPKFSHDGQRIVFVDASTGHNQVYTCRIDGTELKNVSNNTYSDIGPQFSYDDQKIIFFSSRHPLNGLFKMDAYGSGQEFITEAIVTRYSLSPTKEEMAFLKSVNDGFRSAIIVADFNGNIITQVTNNTGGDHSPLYTPDGENLIYISNQVVESKHYSDIKIINLSTNGIEYLLKDLVQCYQQNLSKNYQYLVFGNSGDLNVYSFLDRTTKNITNNGNGYYNPIIFENR